MKSDHWLFFLLNIVFTWIFWFAAISFGGFTEIIGFLFYIIGGTGPLVSALILVGFKDGTVGIRKLLSRMVQTRSIKIKWLSLSVLIIFIPVITASILEIVFLGTWTAMTNAIVFFSGFSIWTISIIFNLIAVILEEPGWRGLALDSLQKQYNAVRSSIIVGIIWAAWHLPLFVMPGTYQEAIGLGTIGFWLYMGAIPATSILISWFYNNSNNSILAAMVFHLLNNLAGEIFSLDVILEIPRVLVSYLIVLCVIYYFGYDSLIRKAGNDS
ncbi:MAG: CPBP family intramembrane metalloprotease [Candidatus Thorarchaeota archaeon]|nr:CPBP family intramembrane metalloprotease [Candidatus Thorarchaeota archaeon]